MKKKSRFLKNKKGTVFLWTMIMIGLLAIMAGALAKVVSKDVFTAQYLKYSTQAFFLADAGINHAFSQLKADFSNTTSINSGSLSLGVYNGSYTVTFSTNGNNKLATSVGTVRGVARTVVAEFRGPVLPEAFNYAVFGGYIGETWFPDGIVCIWPRGRALPWKYDNSVNITGNVHSNDWALLWAFLGASINITGDVESHGLLSISGDVNISGNTDASAEQIPRPQFDFALFKEMAKNGGIYYSGDHEFNGATITPGNGVVYVDGKATLKNYNTLTGCLIAEKSIEMWRGGYTLIQTKKTYNGLYLPALCAKGAVILRGYVDLEGLVFAYLDINIKDGEIDGCVITDVLVTLRPNKTTSGRRDLTINYVAPSFLGIAPLEVTMVAWSE